ncbi:MAG TPA: hypothetical protein VEX18_00555, partial [Polyangiaceae bacterium]|nr:hypothetical protein [Polyangiaceae bacterium]
CTMSSRWLPFMLAGSAIAGCLVGNYEVNPALDQTGEDGSGASRPSGGKSGASEGGKSGGGEDASAGQPMGTGGAVNDGNQAQGAATGEGGEPPFGGAGAGPVVVTCGYTEQADTSNQHASPLLNGTSEATGQSTNGKVEICGEVHSGHFAASDQVVDIDSYSINVAGAGEIYALVEFAKEVPAEDVLLVVATSDQDQRWVRVARGTGVLWSDVPSGALTVSVAVVNASALEENISYRIRVLHDDFDERCPRATDAVPLANQHLEMNDGANNQGNDVLRVPEDLGIDDEISAIAGSTAEQGLGVETEVHWARGSAGPSTIQPAYGYEDGDAYDLSRLGPTQLSVRLDWDGNADLDLFVFEGQGERLIARSTTRAAGAAERLTFPPSARDYVIWVAAAEGSTGLPQAYELTVCGEGIGL